MPTIRTLYAGVAKSDITTDSPDIIVHDRMYAKAIILDDGVTTLAILVLDAVAIGGICDVSDAFLPALRARIEAHLGIPAAHVLVHATHTHPPVRHLCDEAAQVDRAFDAVRRAKQDMVPVTVGAGRGHEDRILINRTLRLRDGQHWTIRQANPCPRDEAIEGLGPIDPEIGILRFDRTDGRPLAVLFNYACHPLVGVPGGHVTANYPGFACSTLEEVLGPDVMAIFLQGAAGDVTELTYKDVNHPRDSGPIGTMLGLSTLRALRNLRMQPVTLDVVHDQVELPRRTDSDECIAELLEEQKRLLASLRFTSLNFKAFLPLYLKHALDPKHPADYRYAYLHAEQRGSRDLAEMDRENRANLEKYRANIDAMEELARLQDKLATLERHKAINDASGGSAVAAELQMIRIGDCVIVAAPMELLAEVGLRIKAFSPFAQTFVAAFSNGYLHYAPPASDYAKGGYEATECLLDPGWEPLFERKMDELFKRLSTTILDTDGTVPRTDD